MVTYNRRKHITNFEISIFKANEKSQKKKKIKTIYVLYQLYILELSYFVFSFLQTFRSINLGEWDLIRASM